MSEDEVFALAAEALGNPLLAADLKEGFVVHTEPEDWIKFAQLLAARPTAQASDANDLAQYRSDCDVYRRQLAERDATLTALRTDLAMLKRAPRGTGPQILAEREITASAIGGAMAFGYQNTNPVPVDQPNSQWLAPWWQRGRDYAVLEADRDVLAENLDLLMSLTRAVPPFTEILGYTSNAGLLDIIRRVDEARIDTEARRHAIGVRKEKT